jgi:hypothetical protein
VMPLIVTPLGKLGAPPPLLLTESTLSSDISWLLFDYL